LEENIKLQLLTWHGHRNCHVSIQDNFLSYKLQNLTLDLEQQLFGFIVPITGFKYEINRIYVGPYEPLPTPAVFLN
jgi:hypothetical protein